MTAVRIEHDGEGGEVRVRTGKVELGQGLHTALAQIVADGLGVAVGRVRLLPVDTDDSPDEGVTSGSLSVQDAGRALREACAALRSGSGDAPGSGSGSSSNSTRGSGSGSGSGSSDANANPDADGSNSNKSNSNSDSSGSGSGGSDDANVVGMSLPRTDLPRLFAGQPHFIHDLAPDGLLHGRVLHPPRHGLQPLGWDEDAVRGSSGLVHLRRDGSLFGLIAASGADADRAFGRLAAAVRWPDAPPDADESPAALRRLPAVTRLVARREVDADAAATEVRSLRASYGRPWIAHASLAPSCALACWEADGGRLHVRSHSQGIFNLRRDLALAFGLDLAAVRVTHVPGAGCYGHNGADDVAFDAAWLARAVPGRTVRVSWSREDELSHSPFGPAMAVDLEAGLDVDGRIVRWRHDVWSPGHSRRPGRSATPALLGAWQVADGFEPPASIDMPLAAGGGAERNALPGYDFAAWQVHCHTVRTVRRSSALRSLGAHANVFAAESFVDEIARATGADPLELRRRHLAHDARGLAVLDAAAARAGWADGRPREDAVGRGIGCARYKGSGAWCAVVAEVHAGGERLRVRRLTIAVDVGRAVNPDGVVNQIEGGAIQATSWTLLESAAAGHAGWPEYPILRFSEVPAVDVVLLPSEEPSLGAGEASIGPTAAAIANALHDALGVRVRDLPLTPDHIVAAMEDGASPEQPT